MLKEIVMADIYEELVNMTPVSQEIYARNNKILAQEVDSVRYFLMQMRHRWRILRVQKSLLRTWSSDILIGTILSLDEFGKPQLLQITVARRHVHHGRSGKYFSDLWSSGRTSCANSGMAAQLPPGGELHADRMDNFYRGVIFFTVIVVSWHQVASFIVDKDITDYKLSMVSCRLFCKHLENSVSIHVSCIWDNIQISNHW